VPNGGADFIELYDDALDPAACASLIERFERSGLARRGETGSGVDVTLKDSWDIRLRAHREWADSEALLNDALLPGLRRYLRRYPHAALAPLRLQIGDPVTGRPAALDGNRLQALDDATLTAIVLKVFRPGAINLQKYVADQGGYPYWHSELYPKLDDGGESLHRTLLWTIYLNDGFDGGETEFFYQSRRITPRTGSLLIAPAAFTHTHRGNTPRGGAKYIATSWIQFQPAQSLYAAAPR
jgi:hypothetical protein